MFWGLMNPFVLGHKRRNIVPEYILIRQFTSLPSCAETPPRRRSQRDPESLTGAHTTLQFTQWHTLSERAKLQGGSQKPSGERLLYAYLRSVSPNHPREDQGLVVGEDAVV